MCDALFRALPLIPADEPVVIGLPDTVWFPEDALRALADDDFSFLLFPVERPQQFDAVLTDLHGIVRRIQVKEGQPESHWIWGAFKMPGAVFAALHRLWMIERGCSDNYIGTLVNAYIAAGGRARGICAGQAYFDVGTLTGYRELPRLELGLRVPGLGPAALLAALDGRLPPLSEKASAALEKASQLYLTGSVGLSLATVRNHIHNTLEKLAVHSKLEAVSLAYRNGWVPQQSATSAAASRPR